MKKKMVMLLLASVMLTGAAGCSSAASTAASSAASQPSTTAAETIAQTASASSASSAAASDSDLPDDLNALFQMENDIFAAHQTLWDKVFASMDKATAPSAEDYAGLLASVIDAIKSDLTEEDLDTLNSDVEQIRKIEEKMTQVQAAENADSTATAITEGTKFPSFSGTDFDGAEISDSFFSENTVTVLNFWFNGCVPCVDELPVLNQLSEDLKAKGGALAGINTETFDNNTDAIATAKELLSSQGASYRNIVLPSDSEAGKYASGIMAFPTTIVVDRNGNIVGDPIVGSLEDESNMKKLTDTVDSVIAADQK